MPTCIKILFLCLTLTGAVLLPNIANAAPPRVEKIKMLDGPAGANTLLLEKFYGSGGNVSVQIKNRAGAVIAYVPLAPYAAVFCPGLQRCMVFPHAALQYLAPAWRLDAAGLAYDQTDAAAAPAERTDPGDMHDDYASYLSYDTVTSYSGPEIGTPDSRLGAQGFTRADSSLWGLASVLFILPDSPLFFALLLVAAYAAVRILQRRKRRKARAMANATDVTGS